jgi:hypothetical protein
MELWLSPEERELLERILSSYLSGVRTELAEARSNRYQTLLHSNEAAVNAIIWKLRPSLSAGVWRDEVEVEELTSAA